MLTVVPALVPRVYAQEQNEEFKNLQVLPPNISEEELGAIMLDNLRGLGLPRLLGRGCLHCHVGDMDQPRDEWDYASDDKLAKRKARVMMAMVREINGQHLPQLEERLDSELRVTCYTCHAGRTDPRPLPTVLLAAYEAGGVDSLEAHYRALRARYFGGDAYDFRVSALPAVARRLAVRGAFDDAIAAATLNVDVYPSEAFAKRTWLSFVLVKAIYTQGVDSALGELERIEPELDANVITPGLLDGLAWPLFRQDRKTEAMVLMRENLDRFPTEYVPNESMAFALSDTGDREAAVRILEDWIEKHPDHDRARRTLINMRGG